MCKFERLWSTRLAFPNLCRTKLSPILAVPPASLPSLTPPALSCLSFCLSSLLAFLSSSDEWVSEPAEYPWVCPTDGHTSRRVSLDTSEGA